MSKHEADRRARQRAADCKANASATAAERRAINGSMTILEWCQLRRLSRSMFYKLDAQGLAPQTYSVGTRRLISAEADAAWMAAVQDQNLTTDAA